MVSGEVEEEVLGVEEEEIEVEEVVDLGEEEEEIEEVEEEEEVFELIWIQFLLIFYTIF